MKNVVVIKSYPEKRKGGQRNRTCHMCMYMHMSMCMCMCMDMYMCMDPLHVISTCAACAGDIQNARDRCQPIGQSRTAPCGASHSQPRESLRPWEPKVQSKKQFSPPAKRHAPVRPHRVGCWGARWFSQNRPERLAMAATRCLRHVLRLGRGASGPEAHRRGSGRHGPSEAAVQPQ